MPDIVTIGEASIDFVSTETDVSLRDATTFEKMIGGGPATVAMGLARLEVPSGFVGRVGDDPFGRYLADVLATEGVDVTQLSFERKARTALTFVSLGSPGEGDRVFFRHPSADQFLSPGHINPSYVKTARCIVYGSLALMAEPGRTAVLKALAIARDSRALRVYDLRYHLSLWGSDSEARYGLHLGLERAEVVRLGLDDLEFLSGTRDVVEGTQALWSDRMRLLVVTLGAQGCAYRTASDFGQVAGCRVQTVDATGAAAGFLAGLLAELLWPAGRRAEPSFGRTQVERALHFANAAGALTTTQWGASAALPTRPQVEALCG